VSDPYRTPGAVETAEQRRARYQSELHALMAMNANGRPASELVAMRKRIAELQRLLSELR
jgi:hypothetical protein